MNNIDKTEVTIIIISVLVAGFAGCLGVIYYRLPDKVPVSNRRPTIEDNIGEMNKKLDKLLEHFKDTNIIHTEEIKFSHDYTKSETK